MRAVVMRNGELVVDAIGEPEPGPGQVLVKTLACGICGSDLHALRFGERLAELNRRAGGPSFDLGRDVVMGHEYCAEVLDYGPGSARSVPAGRRVCAVPVTPAPGGLETIGYSNRYPGGYGERMVLTEMLLLEVPNGLPTAHAALTEPMAVGAHAVAMANLRGDEIPLVIGCGPVGLAVVAALRRRGIGPVIAADFSPARRAFAERLGADVVVDPGAGSPYQRWHDLAAPAGYDPTDPLTVLGLGPQLAPCVVFECVGVPGVIQQIIDGAPPHTRAVVVGVCMERDHIEPMLAITKEVNLQFVYGYTPEEFAATLHDLAEGTIDVAPLITGTVGRSGVAAAFAELASPGHHAKILVEPWRD